MRRTAREGVFDLQPGGVEGGASAAETKKRGEFSPPSKRRVLGLIAEPSAAF